MAADLELFGDNPAPFTQLEEMIERVRSVLLQQRQEKAALEKRIRELEGRVHALAREVEAARAAAAPEELARLRVAETEWQTERERIADYVESLAKKLGALEKM
jgi:chromosome segregation ATPase